MLSTFQTDILEAVKAVPGVGPGPIADVTGQDKSYTRRVMRKLAEQGYLIERNNGNGYAYFPGSNNVGHAELRHVQQSVDVEVNLPNIPPHAPIDVPYRDVTPSSTSRALVPSVQPGQPFDSRTEAALRQHAKARRSLPHPETVRPYNPSQLLTTIASPFAASLNSFFVSDPDGDEALAALTGAINVNTRAVQAAQDRVSMEHEAQRRADAAEAAKAVEEAKEAQRQADLHWAIHAMLGMDREPSEAPKSSTPPASVKTPDREEYINPTPLNAEDRDLIETPDPDDFSYTELAGIDAVARRKVQSEPVVEDDEYGDDRVLDPKKVWRRQPTFAQRLAEKRLEVATVVAKEKERTQRVRKLFSRSKTELMPEPLPHQDAGMAPDPPSFWDWLRPHLATSKKGVLK